MSKPHRINIVNRDEYKTFVPSPVEKYQTRIRIKKAGFERFSYDDDYKELKRKGLAIEISCPDVYVNGQKPIDGIFSPLFGADTTQDTPTYTCGCS